MSMTVFLIGRWIWKMVEMGISKDVKNNEIFGLYLSNKYRKDGESRFDYICRLINESAQKSEED